MIILRQKQHSKVKKFLEKAGNELVESRDALSKSLGLGNPIVREQARQKGKKRVSEVIEKIPLTKKELRQLASKEKTKTLEALNKIRNYLKTTPIEKKVGDLGEFAAKRPINALGTAATFPMTSSAVEEAMQRFWPYKQATEWTGRQYTRHIRKPVENMVRVVTGMPW